jgi:hypothetical protein
MTSSWADPTGPGQPAARQAAAASSARASARRRPPARGSPPWSGGPTAPGRPPGSGRPRAPTGRPGRTMPPRGGPAPPPGAGGAGRPGLGGVGSATSRRGARARRRRGGPNRRQDRVGLGGNLGGEVVGAGGQHLGMGRRDRPGGQGLAGPGQGTSSGGGDQAGGGAGSHGQPGPEPAAVAAARRARVGAGGPAGVQVGEVGVPLAFPALHQPPQDRDRFGPAAVGQPTNRVGGQLLELGHHRPSPSGSSVEWVFESMTATDQAPTPTQAPPPHLGTTSPTEPTRPSNMGHANTARGGCPSRRPPGCRGLLGQADAGGAAGEGVLQIPAGAAAQDPGVQVPLPFQLPAKPWSLWS